MWIDAVRKISEEFRTKLEAPLILSALLYAMAYCSQGTGHDAQYRDAKDASSLKDIPTYRRRSLTGYFIRKFDRASDSLPTEKPSFEHKITALDFTEQLATLPKCTVYADPPYCFVHYSRFYHALETLALYDYPEIQEQGGEVVKGRYREVRHQSPFSIQSQVLGAFHAMFKGVAKSQSNLVLSYANTGMITLKELLELMRKEMLGYQIDSIEVHYDHMTMGRKGDHKRQVREYLITAKLMK